MANLKYKKQSESSWTSLSKIRGPKGDNADITINGVNQRFADFYAPEDAGAVGQVLTSRGESLSPQWKNMTIPLVGNGVLTIKQNDTTIGTFGANATMGQSINVEVPVKSEIIDWIYPVGSIYISMNAVNPTTLFGGDWVSFGTGKTIVGVDAAEPLFNTIRKSGGHKLLQAHTHIQNAHFHDVTSRMYDNGGDNGSAFLISDWGGAPGGQSHYNLAITNTKQYIPNGGKVGTIAKVATNQSTGGGDAQNMPPYITVYMWERIG